MARAWFAVGVAAALLAAVAVTTVHGERDFPPPPMPKRPPGFKIFCDICEKMINRAVPFCQREEENMDYLTDFCTYNYNSVLRPECDYVTNVMDYVWCPNACSQVRKLVWHSSEAICKHRLVNCTDRNPYPTPVPSPSPSASMPLSPDCALCEYTLKNVAEMCMNDETANKAAIYQVCMTKTANTRDFDSCTEFLGELVEIAGTRDPCEMLSCEEPKVACKMNEALECHVSEYSKEDAAAKGVLGLDENGNIIKPVEVPVPFHKNISGLGPSDFNPGVMPFHQGSTIRDPANAYGDRMSIVYPGAQHDSYSLDHKDDEFLANRIQNLTMQ